MTARWRRAVLAPTGRARAQPPARPRGAAVAVGRTAAARSAWGLFGLALVVEVAGLVLFVTAPAPPPGVEPVTGVSAVNMNLAMLGFAGVGAVVASRRPGNPLGWLLLAVGILGLVNPTTYLYAIHGFADPLRPLPLVAAAAWFTTWAWIPLIAVLGLTLMLFPTGRLPSRRWRPVVAVAGGGIAASILLAVLLWPHRGVALLATGDDFSAGAAAGNVALPLSFAAFVAGAVALVVRFRRAGTVERLQLKWLLYAAAVAAAGLVASALADVGGVALQGAADVLSSVGVMLMPLAVGIAVTRYRLYDIDRIVDRTIVYAAVTVTLALVYAGSVVALRALLVPITGASDLAVAGSTLAVAALFGPVRRRVQAVVDRRFNRRRYDAAKAVESFGQRLRDRVDLDDVAGELRATAAVILQPATVSIWVAGRGAGR